MRASVNRRANRAAEARLALALKITASREQLLTHAARANQVPGSYLHGDKIGKMRARILYPRVKPVAW